MNGTGNPLAKELGIRKKMKNIYNKKEEDFPSLRAYNDYLEEVEDIIFNLTEGVDVEATQAKVRLYEAENREQIDARKARDQAAAARAVAVQSDNVTGALGSSQDSEPPFSFPSTESGSGVVGTAAARPIPVLQPTPVRGRVEADHIRDLSPEEQAERRERGKRAGGWGEELASKRALQAAMEGLVF